MLMFLRGTFEQTLVTVFINLVCKKQIMWPSLGWKGILTSLTLSSFITHWLYSCNLIITFGLLYL